MKHKLIALIGLTFIGACSLLPGRDRDKPPSDVEVGQAMLTAGNVCGDPGLIGRVIDPILSDTAGCGVASPVELTSVAGLSLTTPASIDCPTAQALKTWVETGVKPQLQDIAGGPVSLRVAAHYVCRTRNHQAGAKISEHGKGKAVDISGIVMADGQVLSVADQWRGTYARQFRAMHQAACGPFGTVLGPESDRFHQSHFHLDTAAHRGGAYCR